MASITVFFEKLIIHNDSDNIGPGAFTFVFQVNGQKTVEVLRPREKHSRDFFDLIKMPNNSYTLDLAGGTKLIVSGNITEHDDGLTFGNDRASADIQFDPRSFPVGSTTAKNLHFHGDGIHAELIFSIQCNISFNTKDFVVYEHDNFEGNFQIISVAKDIPTMIDIEKLSIGNDSVSSVEMPIVFQPSEFRPKMLLFEHAREGGNFLELDTSHANLSAKFFWREEGRFMRRVSWNDLTSCLRAMWVSNRALVVFADRCYSGQAVSLSLNSVGQAVTTFESGKLSGSNDVISSLTLPADHFAVLYDEDKLKGNALLVQKDIPELRYETFNNVQNQATGWHDRTSSIRLIATNKSAVFSDKTYFAGDYFERELPPEGKSVYFNLKDFSLGDNNLKSLVTSKAEVILYDLKDKKGKSFRLSPNTIVPDIATLDNGFGWQNKVSSVEIRVP